MKRHYYGWIWLVAPALFAGCGGGSGTGIGDLPVVPSSVDYFDAETQAVSHRVRFDYSTPKQIHSEYLTPGEDGLWGTADDISSPFLTCHYEEDEIGLPYQRFLPLVSYQRSPTGSVALAVAGLPGDETTLCPALDGHALTYEARCAGEYCPTEAAFPASGYELTISRVRDGNLVLDTQVMKTLGGGVEAPSLTQTQETRISLDDEGRVLGVDIELTQTNWFDDIMANICEEGPSIAIELLIYRSCSTLKESARYQYDDESVSREADFYSGWNFYLTSYQQRVIDRHDGTLTITTRGTVADPNKELSESVYHFDQNGNITASVRRSPGEDGELHTDDDTVVNGMTYYYRDDGRPVGYTYENSSYSQYRYDRNARLREFVELSLDTDQPIRRSTMTYNRHHRTSATLYASTSMAAPAALVKTLTIHYQLAPEGIPQDFFPSQSLPSAPINVADLMRKFDI
ncbi:MAG: hypothetical protein P1U78_05595 [Alcanivoracaceae bacterium]|nr:hypothetical protein [Alcanivoracaceae bacterium]